MEKSKKNRLLGISLIIIGLLLITEILHYLNHSFVLLLGWFILGPVAGFCHWRVLKCPLHLFNKNMIVLLLCLGIGYMLILSAFKNPYDYPLAITASLLCGILPSICFLEVKNCSHNNEAVTCG